jgi:uncharacterized protein with GYD domain
VDQCKTTNRILHTVFLFDSKLLRSKSFRELKRACLGVRIVSQYAVLGPYDFANIEEAPDNKIIGKVSIELGSRGTIRIVSMAAIPIDEFVASMKKR